MSSVSLCVRGHLWHLARLRLRHAMQSVWPTKHPKGTKTGDRALNQVIGFKAVKGNYSPNLIPSEAYDFLLALVTSPTATSAAAVLRLRYGIPSVILRSPPRGTESSPRENRRKTEALVIDSAPPRRTLHLPSQPPNVESLIPKHQVEPLVITVRRRDDAHRDMGFSLLRKYSILRVTMLYCINPRKSAPIRG